ncbi:MAG: aspartate/glutamate racemase family protein [Dehalococcoidia bacterium]
MKSIGILGGMAPESTVEYYRTIIEICHQRGLGHSYPVIVIYSVNFHEFVQVAKSGNKADVTDFLARGIDVLSGAGAEFALMASNTPHMVFNELNDRSPIPLLSIVEATAKAANEAGYKSVGLMGTKFTMQADFYSDVLSNKYGISTLVPEEPDQDYVNDKIMNELVNGIVSEDTRQGLSNIAGAMRQKGIEALILGCTELPMVISEETIGFPVLNTTIIHAEAAMDYSLA